MLSLQHRSTTEDCTVHGHYHGEKTKGSRPKAQASSLQPIRYCSRSFVSCTKNHPTGTYIHCGDSVLKYNEVQIERLEWYVYIVVVRWDISKRLGVGGDSLNYTVL